MKKPVSLVITFMFVLTLSVHCANETSVTVDGSVTHQKIDGFGFRSTAEGQIRNMPTTEQQNLLDLIFDVNKGVGMSIVRVTIRPDFEPTQGNYDISGEADMAWFLTEAQTRGVNTFFGSPWSPPAWMKTNNNLVSGRLDPNKYADYAKYLARWVIDLKTNYSIDMYGVSIQNEPDIDPGYISCLWNGQELHDFLDPFLKDEWIAQGLNTKIMMAEEGKWPRNRISETLSDPATEPLLDIIARHGYGTLSPFKLSNTYNKPVWQTEENGNHGTGGSANTDINDGLFWAERLHKWLTEANVNAWLWHWLVMPTNWNKNFASNIIHIESDNELTIARRLYTIGQYSKFIRPGYYRIDCTKNPSRNVYASAYQDPVSGEFSIVAINANSGSRSVNFKLNSLSTNSVTPYTTTASKDIEVSKSISVLANSFAATLPPKSVTTFIGVAE
jgi:glucuronoarabinoxylan endo-1,4-beta-xylanase